jgi:hypothetical protein
VKTILSAILVCAHAHAVQPWVVDRIIQVESSGNPWAIGDKGLAIGLGQFHHASWHDTSTWRRSHGMSVHSYAMATNPTINRSYLVSWLQLNEQRFLHATGQLPTPSQLYAIHQLGFNGFKKRQFDIKNCPPITQRKTKHFNQ